VNDVLNSLTTPATNESPGQSPPQRRALLLAGSGVPTSIPTTGYRCLVRGTKRKRREGVWELRVDVGRDPVSGKPRQI